MTIFAENFKAIFPNVSDFFRYLRTRGMVWAVPLTFALMLPFLLVGVLVHPLKAREAIKRARHDAAAEQKKRKLAEQENNLYPLW